MKRLIASLFCVAALCMPAAAHAQGHGGHAGGAGASGAGPAAGRGAFPEGRRAERDTRDPRRGFGGRASAPATGTVSTRSGLRLGPPGRWWNDHAVSQTIGLTHDQQKRMDAIFNASRPALIESYQTFQKRQAALDALTRNPQVDKAQVFAAIDAVNEARSALAKTNTEMLLQIRQQLQPEQVSKLDTIQ